MGAFLKKTTTDMRHITHIFIHCTATPQTWGYKELMAEFRNKGWKAPGYHYAITPSGELLTLADEDTVANGVKGYNQHAIHIAYIGGISIRNGKTTPLDNRTTQQRQTITRLLRQLRTRYPQATILGHRDIWGSNPNKWLKACPCFNAREEYSGI